MSPLRLVVAALIMLASLAGCGLLVGFGTLPALEETPDAQADSPARPDAEQSTDAGNGTEGGPKILSKVDLLFDIDNSTSMGDKQQYLINTIPEIVGRLITPQCVVDGVPSGYNADSKGKCGAGVPQFAPVHDMHIGIVTSSLGPRLPTDVDAGAGAVCAPYVWPTQGGSTVNAFNDDKAHLINRTIPFGSGPPLAAAVPGNFLEWFPSVATNADASPSDAATPITSFGMWTVNDAGDVIAAPGAMVGDFYELVAGAGSGGCGIESQLESWYRFLIQPDPYLTLVTAEGAQVAWFGVDSTIIQQRHDFLRPDSVVAVIVLSDENDSEIDIRSAGTTGDAMMSLTFKPPRATTACLGAPNDPGCQTCPAPCPPGATSGPCADPNCQLNGGSFTDVQDLADWGWNANLRHVHMRQKYGADLQFPLTRYSNGLTSTKVPNRFGEYPTVNSTYTGTNNCTNPLFAAALPQATDVPDYQSPMPDEIVTGGALCSMPIGSSRNAGDIFYLHIGGVPYQLLQATPSDGVTCDLGRTGGECPQKASLTHADWVKILGQGPASYTADGGVMSVDYTGIDPHMIESVAPRNHPELLAACIDGGTSCPGAAEPAPNSNPPVTTLSGPSFDAGADAMAGPLAIRPDPINGREWTTNLGVHDLNVNLQFACIFPLPVEAQMDCALLNPTTIEAASCDCPPMYVGGTGAPMPTGNTPDEIPPICGVTSTDLTTVTSAVNDYTVQTHGRAFPTIRELMLANMLGNQGVISSICPIDTIDFSTGDDPLYGYRPAMDALVNRMAPALAHAK